MRPKILLVDDEPNVTQGLRVALRQERWDVATAASAVEALEILRKEPIHVVVSDERMPGMSGSEFLAQVRRIHPSTMRIILTGQASLEATMRAINEGEIFRFLRKPCPAEEVRAAIHNALEHRRLMATAARLLHTSRHQAELLDSLEAETPGITQVSRDDSGAFVIDPDEYEMLDGIENADDLMQQALSEIERSVARFRRSSKRRRAGEDEGER